MTTTPKWLDHAARRSSERPWTLGSALDEYRGIEKLTDEQLSDRLGCSISVLAWLSLCRRPAPEHFSDDILKIAERFQIEAPKLAQILRHVDVVTVLRRPDSSQEDESLLLAARDRDEEKDK